MTKMLRYTPNEKTAAIYVRISDEEKKRGTYDSIGNQIKILKELAAKKGLTNLEVYRDDSRTGGNFDRPDFNRMISDIENRKVNCVLVKDLSRFGREHIDGDYYLEIFLPKHNVRFITQHEGFDSYLDPQRMNSIEAPLINLFNEQYLRQVSNSTKASLKIKRKEGKYVLPQVPYGYLRSPADKYKLIVDEDVRHVIEDIFTMYLSNKSLNEIAHILERKGILPPSQLKRKRKGLTPNPDVVWRAPVVKSILSQDILTGHMVQGKTVSYSHKVKTRTPLPKEQWIIVRDTHEKIIDEDTFNQVQTLLSKQTRPKTRVKNPHTAKPSVLAGYVVCADCLSQMQRSKTTKDGKAHYYYRCKTNKQLGRSSCSSHLIAEDVIMEVLLSSINSLIDSFVDVEAALCRNANNETALMRKRLQHQLDAALIERERITNTRANAFHSYINKLDETLTDEAYVNLRESIERMDKDNKERISSLKQDLEMLGNGDAYMTSFIQRIEKYQGIKELTRDLLASLVERILIDGDKSIRVEFKFQDEIQKYALLYSGKAVNG